MLRLRNFNYKFGIGFYIFAALFLFVQYQKHPIFRTEDVSISKHFQSIGSEEVLEEISDSEIPKTCQCTSPISGKVFDFCYKLPEYSKITGKRFDCKWVEDWEKIESASKFVNLKTDKIPIPDPVFVTAFSNGFVPNGKRLIKSIRKLGLKNKIVLYDLGIEKKNLKSLEKSCNLEIRTFNFSNYPSYMKTLRDYRWKAIVIAETLRDYGAIWYLDSSVIFEKSNVSHVYDLVKCHSQELGNRPPILSSSLRDLRESREPHENGWNLTIWNRNLKECRKSNYLLHGYSGHGILSVTNPDVYTYIPTNSYEMKKQKAKMYDAGFVYAVNTKQTMIDIVKWYFLCALEEKCMAPQGSQLSCQFVGGDRFGNYADCHRFDQSIINLVLANRFWYDRHYYASEIVDFFRIDRSGAKNIEEKDLKCF